MAEHLEHQHQVLIVQHRVDQRLGQGTQRVTLLPGRCWEGSLPANRRRQPGHRSTGRGDQLPETCAQAHMLIQLSAEACPGRLCTFDLTPCKILTGLIPPVRGLSLTAPTVR